VPGQLVPTAEIERIFYEVYVSCFELCVYLIQFCFLFVHFPSSFFCLPFDVTAICNSLPHSVGNTYDMSSPNKKCFHCCLLFSTEDGGPYSLHCTSYPVASHFALPLRRCAVPSRQLRDPGHSGIPTTTVPVVDLSMASYVRYNVARCQMSCMASYACAWALCPHTWNGERMFRATLQHGGFPRCNNLFLQRIHLTCGGVCTTCNTHFMFGHMLTPSRSPEGGRYESTIFSCRGIKGMRRTSSAIPTELVLTGL
jgi:hypothetical protein